MGKPQLGGNLPQGFLRLSENVTITINGLRLAISGNIQRHLPGDDGAIAVALMIGDRSGIPANIQESLRKSGLAHILAISGLHMALVTLTVLGLLRMLFSLTPGIALYYPTRKWAAAGGLIAATLYLALSGGAVATFRAWIMLSIMLSAIMMDRKALTIRNVVLAAIVVLIVSPESLLEPGFQMSFAATGALVAAYSQFTKWRTRKAGLQEHKTGIWTAPKIVAAYVFGLAFTSLIAGLATGIFSAWHFHRIAPMGLMSNLLAMPVVSILVMPLALTSALLMPYGLESLALTPLRLAINLVVQISDWVNTFPVPAITGVQTIPVLLCGAGGLLILTLFNTRLRLLGIVPIGAMFLFAGNQPPPDIVVSQDGRAIGVSDQSGKLVLLYPRRNRFIADIWLRAWSGGKSGNRSELIGECDKDHCVATTPHGIRLEVVYNPNLLDASCKTADILVAPRLWWADCRRYTAKRQQTRNGISNPGIILTRLDFEKFGTHEIRFSKTDLSTAESPDQQANEFRITDQIWRAEIETALSDTPRQWNIQRLALDEPVFEKPKP
ncbi:MAG: ComEC/Rec2 family competence protein [Rhizobiaceae bacterium]